MCFPMIVMMIKETIIVEGRDDTAAIHRAVSAHTIETHGFGISAQTWKLIEKAYHTTGIIVFTDPDYAGDQIRKRIMKKFPEAGQAYLDRDAAMAGTDIGIENGSPEAIRLALSKCHYINQAEAQVFSREDLLVHGLWGGPDAAQRRSQVGKALGIGYGNCSSFLNKLNQFLISKEEFYEAIHHISNP